MHRFLFKEECVPKKVQCLKNCDLHKKHGGAHTTHNTGECRRYEKDGTTKKGFKKPNGKFGNQNFAQAIKEGLSELGTLLKKDFKLSRKRVKAEDSDSS